VQNPGLQIIRNASFTATPWKNGGGITHEAIRVPAQGDPFQWRVSVAHIDASGPFSEFAEHNRTMVLLRGGGIELRFAGGKSQALTEPGELIEFDGADSAYCELLKGPCVDLNLMVLKSQRASARVERVIEPLPLGAARDETMLVFAIDGSCELASSGGKNQILEPWDLALLSQGSGELRRVQTADGRSTAVFLATLKFVGGE
jgi:hypothetical protein